MNFKIGCCILFYVVISLVDSKSLANKHKNKYASKLTKEPKKRISTQQKIGSGHAKGPMANNVQSSVPLPVVMPFPMIPFDDRYPIIFKPNGKPKKGKEKKKDPKGETEDETDKDVDDDNDGGEKGYKGQGRVTNGPYLKGGTGVVAGPNSKKADAEEDEEADDESVNEEKNKLLNKIEDTAKEDNEDDEAVQEDDDEEDGREKKKEQNTFDEKNDEEESKSKKNSKRKSHKKGKSRDRRAIYKPIVGNPEDILPYIMLGSEEDEILENPDGHVITTRDVEQETEDYDIPHDIHTRDVEDEEEDEEEAHELSTRAVNEEEEDEARDMKPRSVPDEIPDLQSAEKKFKDTQQAADILTQIQKALGANPESSVEETHSLADILRKDMESYDEEIAKDILATQNAQTRSKIIVNDDGGKGNAELNNAKRKLESDRAKEQEIRSELKELKDIELMTTQLELAKYLATENAHHQLQFAQALNRAHVQATPQPAEYQNTYTPLSYQQPAPYTYSYTPPMQEVQVPRQPAAMTTPWQHTVYPQAINYAFSPGRTTSGSFRYELENVGKVATPGSSFGTRHETPSVAGFNPQREAVRLPQASYNREPSFQQAIEPPRPAAVVHTEAQSRHVTRPNVAKPKPSYAKMPYAQSRFYPKVKPYGQTATSNAVRERPVASLAGGRKPNIIFPGPTYSPPPFTTRNGRPKIKYVKNRYNSYNNRYGQPRQAQKPRNPALMTFFNDQHQGNTLGNLYHSQDIIAQQHMPMYTHEAYRVPIANPDRYHVDSFHTVEKDQPHFNINSPFMGYVSHPLNGYHVTEYSMPNANQPESSLTKTQITAPKTQYSVSNTQPADFIGTQHGAPFQYALPRPQGPSFGAPAPVIYQAPASYSESLASSKGGIPSMYAPYYATSQMLAPVHVQAYAQTSRPFQTMNTDSDDFHAEGSPHQNTKPAAPQMENLEKVPLGYGLFPLPENADKKMDEDIEEQKLSKVVTTDTANLQDTKQAAEAVTKIENQVGFDPGSIAKLVDFVKQAAEKDVDLSTRAMKRDQTTIKKMEIEHVNNKKSDISKENDIAMKEAQEKLKIDTELLRESKDRLEKVKKMELIVTGIEAAKYSALTRKQDKLDTDVQKLNTYKGSKKTVVGRKGFVKRAS